METSKIKNALLEAKKVFRSTAEDLNNHLRLELGLVVNELPSDPGRQSWKINLPTGNKVYLDFYATGEMVMDTTINNEPDMDPVPGNCFDLTKPLVIENLIANIKRKM
jgi:hypothetical protein